MFGTIAKLFKRSAEPAPTPARSVTPRPGTQPAAAPSQSARTLPRNETPPARPAPRPARPAGSGNGQAIVIPYSSIIRGVPQELWGKLAPAGAGAAEFQLPREIALDQLPQGAVKVSFSELRLTAPSGLFANNASQDGRLIDLPLGDILAQLQPDSFARRANQRAVQISDDVPDLFGNKGERLAPLRVMDKDEAAASLAATRQNAPAARQVLPVETPSVQQPPARKAAAAPAPASRASVPTSPAPTPIKANIPLTGATPVAKAAVPTAKPVPPVTAPVAKPAAPAAAKPLPKAAPSKPASAVSLPQNRADQFFVAVDAVAAGWPEEIRQELAQMKIPGARLVVPAADICEGLKRRLVQFPWGTLRGWIQPQPADAEASSFDHVVLELPLPVITPLFLDHIRSSPNQGQVAESESITEFFRRTEVAAPIPVAAPVSIASRPAPASAPAASATPEGSIDLPLGHISAAWPEVVKRDIAQFNLAQSLVRLPCEYVDAGLKGGKVEFTWRQVCAWLQPSSPPAQLSINGEQRVVFPLHIVAPLFIKRGGAMPAQRKVRVDQEIPDLFSAGGLMPQPAAAPAPAPAAPAAAPVPVAAAPEPCAASAAPKATARSLAELFNEPDKRSWTPNDIVHRASQLPGVAGALIALQDGLLVAACMPPNTRTETIAAFVPQIFGRMSQYTRELQMGETKGVSFTVDSGTLQVFNAGIIYFAALSKTGAQLPVPELQLIATELSRHTK